MQTCSIAAFIRSRTLPSRWRHPTILEASAICGFELEFSNPTAEKDPTPPSLNHKQVLSVLHATLPVFGLCNAKGSGSVI